MKNFSTLLITTLFITILGQKQNKENQNFYKKIKVEFVEKSEKSNLVFTENLANFYSFVSEDINKKKHKELKDDSFELLDYSDSSEFHFVDFNHFALVNKNFDIVEPIKLFKSDLIKHMESIWTDHNVIYIPFPLKYTSEYFNVHELSIAVKLNNKKIQTVVFDITYRGIQYENVIIFRSNNEEQLFVMCYSEKQNKYRLGPENFTYDVLDIVDFNQINIDKVRQVDISYIESSKVLPQNLEDFLNKRISSNSALN